MNEPVALGFGHFIAQSDMVGKTILVILLSMSVISWSLIFLKGIASLVRQRRSRAFLAFFWNASSLDTVDSELAARGAQCPQCPFSHLAAQALRAHGHHARFCGAKLEEAGTQREFLTRTMRKIIDEETARLENGLTALATIGSTAPFVGLFGTVWGIYHALLAIGMSGSGTLDRVAGPVGEALIMTALGLAVAIPSVVGYNWLVRSNRVLLARIDAFAHELFTFLSLGRPMAHPEMPVKKQQGKHGSPAAMAPRSSERVA